MENERSVTLEWWEHKLAGIVGVLRQAEARRCSMQPSSTKQDHPTKRDVDAAGAEMAVAKFLNRYWLGFVGGGGANVADVAPDIEVRQTDRLDGRLLVRKRNLHPDRPYVLVRGVIPTYEIVGWIYGRDAVREEWLEDPRGDGECYMVPESALSKIFRRNGKE